MESLQLQFSGPHSWDTLQNPGPSERDIVARKGIYLWTVGYEGGYLIYLVGWTGTSFAKRFIEHRREYTSGRYTIFDAVQFGKGVKQKLWPGIWWTREGAKLRGEFPIRKRDLEPKMAELWSVFRFFLAPLEEADRVLGRIEAAIMNRLYHSSNPVIAGFPDKGMRLVARNPQEAPVRIQVVSTATLA